MSDFKLEYKHGLGKTPEYRAWQGMKDRCSNKNKPNYHRYGGRGIKVCDIWRLSFTRFLYDMGKRPSPKHSLDRIDNDGNYEPGNCRWTTIEVQANNRGNSVKYEVFGESLTASQIAREYNISTSCLKHRLEHGWDIIRAVTTPVKVNKDVFLEYKGKNMRLSEWAKELDVKYNTLYKRHSRNYPVAKILKEYK